MGRLHSKGKGISASAVPYSRTAPAWLKTTPEQVVDQICKLAKKGATPSQIGVVLRDSHGVAQVKIVTGMFGRSFDGKRMEVLTLLLRQVTRSSGSSRATVRTEPIPLNMEETTKKEMDREIPMRRMSHSSSNAAAAYDSSLAARADMGTWKHGQETDYASVWSPG